MGCGLTVSPRWDELVGYWGYGKKEDWGVLCRLFKYVLVNFVHPGRIYNGSGCDLSGVSFGGKDANLSTAVLNFCSKVANLVISLRYHGYLFVSFQSMAAGDPAIIPLYS